MAASFQDTEAIKIALFEELQKILSADTAIRKKAEERLRQLQFAGKWGGLLHLSELREIFFSDGYGVYLAEIIVNQNLDLALRQLSSVMLKQYVETAWNSEEGTIVAPEQAKKMIKSILPEGLYDSNSKVGSWFGGFFRVLIFEFLF